MKSVKCLKDGTVAVPGSPGLPAVSFKEGDVLTDVTDAFADRLIEIGLAESSESKVESVPEVKAKAPKKSAFGKKGSSK